MNHLIELKNFAFHTTIICIILLLSSVLIALKISTHDDPDIQFELQDNIEKNNRPNIIFFASDGIESRLTSAYGFPWDSTPFLKTLLPTSLVAENAFSVSGKSTGSTTALLTGRSPFNTKVGFPPQILSGQDSFLHLPAILRKLGYRGFQGGVRYYIDSGDINLLQSFDEVNGRKIWNPASDSFLFTFSSVFNSEIYFSNRIMERIISRLLHISGLQEIVSHYLLVSKHAAISWEKDRSTIDQAIDFIHRQKTPFFAHIHLMGTHCCDYRPSYSDQKVESSKVFHQLPDKDKSQQQYINAIRDSDDHLAYFIKQLIDSGQYENTILIITSDHSHNWSSLERVPLVIKFPDEKQNLAIQQNVSHLDIAPTLLDYMQINKPDWMEGISLLPESGATVSTASKEEHATDKNIITMESHDYTRFRLKSGALSRMNNPGSPNYGVTHVGVISCDMAYKISVNTGKTISHKIKRHTGDCTKQEILSIDEASKIAQALLTSANFNTPFQHTP